MNELINKIREFAAARDWGQFHSPKNLTMALSVEAAELMEHFLWLTEDESRNLDAATLAKVRDEMGDIQIYLANFADKVGVDLIEAAHEKLEKSALNYPVEKARGRATKYTDL
jgi:dCTP diphosphatase